MAPKQQVILPPLSRMLCAPLLIWNMTLLCACADWAWLTLCTLLILMEEGSL